MKELSERKTSQQNQRVARLLEHFVALPANEQEQLLKKLLKDHEASFLFLETVLNRKAMLSKQQQERVDSAVSAFNADFFQKTDGFDIDQFFSYLYENLHHVFEKSAKAGETLVEAFQVTGLLAQIVADEILNRYGQTPDGFIYRSAFKTIKSLWSKASTAEKKDIQNFSISRLTQFERDSTAFEYWELFLIQYCRHRPTAQARVTDFESNLYDYLKELKNSNGSDSWSVGVKAALTIRAMKLLRMPTPTINAFKKQFSSLFPVVAIDAESAIEKGRIDRAIGLLAKLLKRVPQESDTARKTLLHLIQLERKIEDFDHLVDHAYLLWNNFNADFPIEEFPTAEDCVLAAERITFWDLEVERPEFEELSDRFILTMLAIDESYKAFLVFIDDRLSDDNDVDYGELIDVFAQYFSKIYDEKPTLTKTVGKRLFSQALLDPKKAGNYWKYAHALRLIKEEAETFAKDVTQTILKNPLANTLANPKTLQALEDCDLL